MKAKQEPKAHQHSSIGFSSGSSTVDRSGFALHPRSCAVHGKTHARLHNQPGGGYRGGGGVRPGGGGGERKSLPVVR